MFALSLLLSLSAAFYYYFQIKAEVYVFVSYALIVPALLCIPRLMYRLGNVGPSWLAATDALGLGFVLLNVPGTVWFHSRFAGLQYDRFLHFSAAMLTVLLFLYFWVGLGGRASNWVPFAIAAAVFIGMFAWEAFQWSQDRLFGTHMFFDYVQSIRRDVGEDLAYGALGIMMALPLSFLQLPSLRRSEKRHVPHR